MGKCFIFKMLFLTRIKALLFTYNVCVHLVLKSTQKFSIAVSSATRQNSPLVQFLNISKVKLKERTPKPHSSTFGHIPTLTLSSGTYQTPSEPVKELSSQTLNTKGIFFFPPVGSAVSCSGSIACAWKRRGQENTAGLEGCRMRVFSSSGLIFQIWCNNHHHQPGKNPRGGYWWNSEDKVCASDGRNPLWNHSKC